MEDNRTPRQREQQEQLRQLFDQMNISSSNTDVVVRSLITMVIQLSGRVNELEDSETRRLKAMLVELGRGVVVRSDSQETNS